MYKSYARDIEIRAMFYAVHKVEIHGGLPEKEARQKAYDAIELRYNLSQTRARIIMSNVAKIDPCPHIPRYIADIKELIVILQKILPEYEKVQSPGYHTGK